MPKKVKTKKQKLEAELRRKNKSALIKQADPTVYSLSIEQPVSQKFTTVSEVSYTGKSSKSASVTLENPYLLKDLKKTILLTASIAIIQIAIKLLFNI
jgi:hypothetical protein